MFKYFLLIFESLRDLERLFLGEVPNFLRHYGLISALIDYICIGSRTAVGKNAEMHTISTRQAIIIEVLAAILVSRCFFCDRIKAKLKSQFTFLYSLLD